MAVLSVSARSSMDSLRSTNSVVHGLVSSLEGAMVWQRGNFDPKGYVVELDKAEVESVRAAVISFKLHRYDRGLISKETFPLPSALARKLSGLSDDIHHGSGIVVLRGLDQSNFNDEEAVIAFAGVSAYVCPERATDAYADQTLSHIRDATRDTVPVWARDLGLAGSKLPSAMDFHCDRFSGDVLALHVRNDGAGEGGGEQYLASFWSIYNELLAAEPAVLETLAKPDWPFELKDRATGLPYLERGPALFFAEGRPILQLVKAPLLGSPKIERSKTMPSITMEQARALHVVEDLARRFSAKLDRRTGDIQYINNLGIMHARSAYGMSNAHRRGSRHLLRMFLRDPENAWAKPTDYLTQFNKPFMPGRKQNLPILDTDPWRKISGMESHG